MTWSDWLNKTSMQSFRSLVVAVVFAVVVLALTACAINLLMDETASQAFAMSLDAIRSDTTKATLEAVAAMRAAAQTSETNHHSYGMQVVNAILILVGTAITGNVVGQGIDRFSAKEHVEAKERGRVSGIAAAAVAAQVADEAKLKRNGAPVTGERPAMQVTAEHAEITQEVGNGELRR